MFLIWNGQNGIAYTYISFLKILIKFTYKIYIKYASREFDDEVIRFRTFVLGVCLLIIQNLRIRFISIIFQASLKMNSIKC